MGPTGPCRDNLRLVPAEEWPEQEGSVLARSMHPKCPCTAFKPRDIPERERADLG